MKEKNTVTFIKPKVRNSKRWNVTIFDEEYQMCKTISTNEGIALNNIICGCIKYALENGYNVDEVEI